MKPTAHQRFLAKCRLNPCQGYNGTGCVEWTGARTRGQGHTAWYGAFKFEGKVVKAHRWAAKHIHELDLPDDMQVDHECRNTLCVEHLAVVTAEVNRELQWIRVQVGLEPEPAPYVPDEDAVPYYIEPEWMRCLRQSYNSKQG